MNRRIRVFVSSTFKDMEADRDHLVKKVFPQLRKLCEERAVTSTAVDLRRSVNRWQVVQSRLETTGP